MTTYHAEYAWLAGVPIPAADVLIEVTDGRFTRVEAAADRPPGAHWLPGLTLPGLANTHSHAFHRALRGRSGGLRAGAGGGNFWTWRERMYDLAQRLHPDTYQRLATATFAEMALAGITCVGEFHYLHHPPGGGRYADPNAMGHALIAAAGRAGIRITLLDALYLTSTVDGDPLEGVQHRFGDGSVAAWAQRTGRLAPEPHARIGAAAHSVRAVPADALTELGKLATDIHIHLSEQPAENTACQARYGCSPTELLERCGLLGAGTTAVHATHLSEVDVRLLGGAGTTVCLCPTTERDLADGIGPGRALRDAGAALCLGSDSHAVIDLFEEARGIEAHERLATRRRGHFDAGELLTAASATGHRALGWPDAGTIAPGQRADLVTVRLDSVRTAGTGPAGALAAATAADVWSVIVDGRDVVREGRHTSIDVPRALATAALETAVGGL
ncbi:MAG: formimidoylglutamate deiminase [Micromonosporaceae bacterium]|nr:formimidoylglutamate deiminase [Micromonosporaceae bacterium]